jgi:hypothetical protein
MKANFLTLPIPSSSRQQLRWVRFEDRGCGCWHIQIAREYSDLFQYCFPTLRTKLIDNWSDSESGRTVVATYRRLVNKEDDTIRDWIAFFERAVLIGINKHLRPYFHDELDFALALDFNKPEPGDERTEIGQYEYEAKY